MTSNPSVKKILFLAANPKKAPRLRLDKEVREIKESLRRSQHREKFLLEQEGAVRSKDIRRAVLDERPNIIHFSGHGSGTTGLSFEDETGEEHLVTGEALAEFFKEFTKQVECVLLNACYSEFQADVIVQHIDYVIGMNDQIGDEAAIEFAVGFYDALAAHDPQFHEGSPIEFAFNIARNAIKLAGVSGDSMPVLKKKPSHKLIKIRQELQVIIDKKIKDFVGREYVFEEISKFLKNHSNGYFIIEGDPGIGKSSFLAEYVQRNKCIAYFNYLSSGNGGNVRAKDFLESVCKQLIARYNLPYPSLLPIAIENGVFLLELLYKVQEVRPNEILVIAIDALDEVIDATSSPDSLINILYLPANLPDGVYFIVTKRRVKLTLSVRVPKFTLDLMKYSKQNLEDARSYIRQEVTKIDKKGVLKRLGLQIWIKQQHLTVTNFIAQLAEKSEGNFMYLFYILNSIEVGFYANLSLETLPSDLNDYYNDLCIRVGMFSGDLRYTKAQIAYILSETNNPIPYEEIVEIIKYTGVKNAELIVDEVFEVWIQVLHQQLLYEQDFYSPYHHTYREFLRDKKTVERAGIIIKEIKNLMASSMDLYGDG